MRSIVGLLALFASLAALAGESITYYHNDLLGSPVAATDSAGYVRWRAAYRPYGDRDQTVSQQLASADNERWYTGHVHDEQTGLAYAQARFYDPTLGRFLSVDPIGFVPTNERTFGRYIYANNNPYLFVDPDGGSALTKAIKLALKGGDVGAAFADVIQDAATAFNPSALQRAGAALSLLSEAAPVSVSDLRDLGRIYNAIESRLDRVPHQGGSASGSIWSSTSVKSAVENAFGHWKKHASEFPEFANSKQYVDAARSLAANPPAGALIKTRGADTLIYDQARKAKVAEIGADIRSRGLIPVRELKVQTPDGECPTKAYTGGVETYQVGRSTKGGVPVARERRAMDDINATGSVPAPVFVPYNR